MDLSAPRGVRQFVVQCALPILVLTRVQTLDNGHSRPPSTGLTLSSSMILPSSHLLGIMAQCRALPLIVAPVKSNSEGIEIPLVSGICRCVVYFLFVSWKLTTLCSLEQGDEGVYRRRTSDVCAISGWSRTRCQPHPQATHAFSNSVPLVQALPCKLYGSI